MEERTVTCPAGYTGEIYQNRSFTIYSDNSKQNYSEWTQKGSTCQLVNTGSGTGWKAFYKDYYAGKTISCSVRSKHVFSVTISTDGTPTFRTGGGNTCSGSTSCYLRYSTIGFSAYADVYLTFNGFGAKVYGQCDSSDSGCNPDSYVCSALFN